MRRMIGWVGIALLTIGCRAERVRGELRPGAAETGARADAGGGPVATPGGGAGAPIATAAGAGVAGAGGARRALAALRPASGSKAEGKATFADRGGGVLVVVDIANAPPGKHGIHVHERGDCSDPKAMSAGAHFAPEGHAHGLPGSPERHLGDLGNVDIGKDGTGRLEITVPRANLRPGDSLSFVDRALVLHALPDTGKGPSGESGDRIACGRIAPPP